METIKRSDKIICISNKTKSLINHFSIDKNKIEVVYLASGYSNNSKIINIKKKYGNFYFLLVVGMVTKFSNFVKAYSVPNSKKNFKLIFFGGEKINLDYKFLEK